MFYFLLEFHCFCFLKDYIVNNKFCLEILEKWIQLHCRKKNTTDKTRDNIYYWHRCICLYMRNFEEISNTSNSRVTFHASMWIITFLVVFIFTVRLDIALVDWFITQYTH